MVGRNLSLGVLLALVASVLLPVASVGAQQSILCGGEVATIVGTPGNDVLVGTPGRDVISGLQGDDFIDGLAGDDVLCGGFGSDVLVGSDGFDLLFGAQGDDTLYAAGQELLIPPFVLDDVRGARMFGGAGNDLIVGSDRWDRMQGGPGNDRLLGFAGNDWMRGGPGTDHVIGHNGSDDLLGGGGSDVVLGDRRDSAVRGGGGHDFCPDLTNTQSWRGCESRFGVNSADSTLPGFSVPREISGGTPDTYVYLGMFDGVFDFVGTTRDLREVFEDDRFEDFAVLNFRPLTAGQADAVAQLYLNGNQEFINRFNFLDPAAPFFDDAIDWAIEYVLINGQSTLDDIVDVDRSTLGN